MMIVSLWGLLVAPAAASGPTILGEMAPQAMLPEVFCVASNRRPAVMTVLAWLLRWPDLTLGRRFVEGFTLLGHIEEPAIFNKLDVPAPVEGSVGLGPALGAPAASVVDRVIKSLKPDEHAAFISDFTRGEIDQGLALAHVRRWMRSSEKTSGYL